ncbi:hypothetical protein [Glacieibacterium frigidum]|uniref:Uncharacterized protein n=1 Tax=Glacieibacterium frigidum TaxID=2593303 RepID=A0A552UFQ7_9SPHN|nr:hypothetical protein [Glacieibacterium frigidum]TRW17034.1 hypothetical protein FMM06_02160 [Glacieibacterium frigidum]
MDDQGLEYDAEKIAEPVTKGQLWSILLKVDLLAHAARTLAIAVSIGNKDYIKEMTERYDRIDKEFEVERDALVVKGRTGEFS